MTTEQFESAVAMPPAPAPRRWPRRAGAIAGGLVILLAGVGIGSASASNDTALHAAQHTAFVQTAKVRTLQGQLTAANAKVTADAALVASAQQEARQATAKAQAQARSDYAVRNAALAARAKALHKGQRALARLLGQVMASKVGGESAVYVVGKDMQPGIYHTSGGGESYYATLSSTSTSDILDNNNFSGPETVDVTGAYAFETDGPAIWFRVG